MDTVRQVGQVLLSPWTGLVWLVAISIALLELAPFDAVGACVAAALLIVLAEVDMRTYTLPNPLTLLLALLGIAFAPVWWQAVVAAVVGYGVFQLVALGSLYLAKKQGLGQGDVKLFGALGAWVGLTGLPLVALVASVSALVYILLVRHPRGKRLPFGPFLALGGWVVLVYQYDMWNLLGGL